MTPKTLQHELYREIPITQALGISVERLESNNILISAPFDNNKNIHNTAFAGSIYTTATLAGWSLLYSWLAQNEYEGSVVLAQASIKYLKPIHGAIKAYCSLPEAEQIHAFTQRFEQRGRARLPLRIEVIEDRAVKAILEAEFAVLGSH